MAHFLLKTGNAVLSQRLAAGMLKEIKVLVSTSSESEGRSPSVPRARAADICTTTSSEPF